MRELLADATVALWRLATTPLRRLIRAEVEEVFARAFAESIASFPTGTPADGIADPFMADLYVVEDDGPRR